MFGNYQHSNLRVEIEAGANKIGESLVKADKLKQWLWPQQLNLSSSSSYSSQTPSASLTEPLREGQTFSSSLGLLKITHEVETVSSTGIRFVLSGGIDGFHEWQWGDGWVQSRLEGVSLLPLNLAQTFSLMRLKQHLKSAQS